MRRPLFRAAGISKSLRNDLRRERKKAPLEPQPPWQPRSGVPEGRCPQILRKVHLTVRSHEVIAIVGPSGVGKSTLLRIFVGDLAPDPVGGGEVMSLWRDPAAQLVWQPQLSSVVFTRSVLANVALGALAKGLDRSAASARARVMLKLVGLEGVDHYFPAALSVGMRQRVALARSLAAEPRLAFLDEPLSSLDPELRRRVSAALRTYTEERSAGIVVVTHTVEEAIDYATRIYVLSGRPGRVVLVAARSQDGISFEDEAEAREVAVLPRPGELFERVLRAIVSGE